MVHTVRTRQGVTFSGIESPPTEAQVQELEAALAHAGHRLPDDYREFLLLFPGGTSDPASFVFGEGSGLRSSVHMFYWLSALMLSAQGADPSDVRLPIAGASRGVLTLGIDPGPDFGKVWISRRANRPIELVADSFDGFLRKLEVAPPAPPPRKKFTEQGVTLSLDTQPATEEAVVTLEEQIGSRLPEDYRRFMLRYNGGTPDPATFAFIEKTYGKSTSDAVRAFFSLGDHEYYALEDSLATYTDRIPNGTLPIAEDGCGNLVLLGISGEDDAGQAIRGKVYFWDHELEPQDPLDWSNVSPVADSFDDFLRGLKP